ncbi:DUF4174 domain-containing protein [Spirosoma rhododendri]|uniref:DUF4174 domain-containing protein n=1 Tax=Spirosoma rhododendri TaxID=2728024 RepID=A0A7L5DMU7_9BACT|nr:DUF4174 domain-containing protein [Spirosoma rhododendri]QJD78811.1 DUF4174 domain-containing protein [Spirosoma rhododendri]
MRKWLIMLPLLLLGTLVQAQTKPLKNRLREKRDDRRVLLFYGTPSGGLTEQQRKLQSAQAELDDRDMDVITLDAATVSAADRQFLEQTYKLNPNVGFMGWLIGKDGGVKETYRHPVDPAQLFGLVDKMPMRKIEMRRKQ